MLTLQTARFLVRLAQAAATGKAAANSGMGAYLFEDVYVVLGLQGCCVRAVWACMGVGLILVCCVGVCLAECGCSGWWRVHTAPPPISPAPPPPSLCRVHRRAVFFKCVVFLWTRSEGLTQDTFVPAHASIIHL